MVIATPPASPAAPSPDPFALRAALVQFVLGVGWISYVFFLPGMLDLAGIDRGWLIWLLLADQLLFGLADWTVGLVGDRIDRLWSRIGWWIGAGAIVSSAAMLAMPWAASLGSPGALVAVTVVWITASSALRAPVVAMLGRAAKPASKASLVAMLLAGGALATAVAPWLALALRPLDARVALAIGAVALAGASLYLARGLGGRVAQPAQAASSTREASVADPAGASPLRRIPWRLVLPIALVALAFAAAVQFHTVMASAPLYRALGATDLGRWLPLFWIGFATASLAIGLHGRLAARVAGAAGASGFARAALVSALAGVAMLALARFAPNLAVLGIVHFVAGAAWAVLIDALFSRALELASPHKPTAAAGTMFAAMALAAVLRLSFVAATGAGAAAGVGAWPIALWLAAGIGLLAIRGLLGPGSDPRTRSP